MKLFEPYKKTFDFSLVIKTMALWIGLMPVFSYIHELGHSAICQISGIPSTIGFSLTAAYTTCFGNFEDPLGFRLAGGFLASFIALVAFVALYAKTYKKRAWICITLATISIVHFTEMILEGFVNSFYVTSNVMVPIIAMLNLVIMMTLLAKNSKKPGEKKHEFVL